MFLMLLVLFSFTKDKAFHLSLLKIGIVAVTTKGVMVKTRKMSKNNSI